MSRSDLKYACQEMERIVWAKFYRGVYWPAEVKEEVVDGKAVDFVCLFDKRECKRLSNRTKIADWDCSEKDYFLKEGENLKSKQRCLSFKRAVKEAEARFQGNSSQQKSKRSSSDLSSSVQSHENARTSSSRPNSASSVSRDCDSGKKDSDSEGEDLPVAFTPIKRRPESMTRGDVVWAKFKKDPYWPGIFHSMVKGKRPKVWVYFLDSNWNVGDMNRLILPITETCVLPFCCDEDRRKMILEEGSSAGSSFVQSVKYAEEYLAYKAAGKINDIFEYESEPEDDSDNNSLEFPRSTPTNQKVELVTGSPTKSPTKFKDLVTDRSWRSESSKKDQKKLLSAIEKTRPTLEKILEGEIECRRHMIFTQGTTKEKNTLKHSSGYGPIDDDKIAEKVLEKLLKWYNDSRKRRKYNSVTYVSEVWLPEALEAFGAQRVIPRHIHSRGGKPSPIPPQRPLLKAVPGRSLAICVIGCGSSLSHRGTVNQAPFQKDRGVLLVEYQ